MKDFELIREIFEKEGVNYKTVKLDFYPEKFAEINGLYFFKYGEHRFISDKEHVKNNEYIELFFNGDNEILNVMISLLDYYAFYNIIIENIKYSSKEEVNNTQIKS
jgi:hypothetical protein